MLYVASKRRSAYRGGAHWARGNLVGERTRLWDMLKLGNVEVVDSVIQEDSVLSSMPIQRCKQKLRHFPARLAGRTGRLVGVRLADRGRRRAAGNI